MHNTKAYHRVVTLSSSLRFVQCFTVLMLYAYNLIRYHDRVKQMRCKRFACFSHNNQIALTTGPRAAKFRSPESRDKTTIKGIASHFRKVSSHSPYFQKLHCVNATQTYVSANDRIFIYEKQLFRSNVSGVFTVSHTAQAHPHNLVRLIPVLANPYPNLPDTSYFYLCENPGTWTNPLLPHPPSGR